MALTFSDDTESRIITPAAVTGDSAVENALRPRVLNEYLGQSKAKELLNVYINAARLRGEPMDHCLLYGPPGLGKTTLAGVIANEMGVSLRVTSGPAIEKAKDLATLLSKLNENDILFVDEIHRLNPAVEEVLYPAMEDYAFDIIMGKGMGAESLRISLPKFTLIGATTRAGNLTAPLRDRFGVIMRLELYTPEELALIVRRSAAILQIEIEAGGALEIAARSRGTPRIANRMIKRVRDYAEVRGDGRIDLAIAEKALDMLEVDRLGLDRTDRIMLDTMIRKFGGGPVGLDTLAAITGEDAATIEDVYEPYLLQLGYIMRTPRGRICTPQAYEHLGLAAPSAPEGTQTRLDI